MLFVHILISYIIEYFMKISKQDKTIRVEMIRSADKCTFWMFTVHRESTRSCYSFQHQPEGQCHSIQMDATQLYKPCLLHVKQKYFFIYFSPSQTFTYSYQLSAVPRREVTQILYSSKVIYYNQINKHAKKRMCE